MQSDKRLAFASHRIGRRNGVSTIECFVAATLVLSILGFVSPLVVRSARIWKQTRHYQFAVDELAGQMDRLVAMTDAERSEQIEQLRVSDAVGEVSDDARLVADIIDDNDGRRIELSIHWNRIGDPPPVRLVAWIDPNASDVDGASESAVDEVNQEEES